MFVLRNFLVMSLTFFFVVTSVAEEKGYFVVVNKLPVRVEVSQTISPQFVSSIDFLFSLVGLDIEEYGLIQEVSLGTNDCAKVSLENGKNIQILSVSSTGEYENICSFGKCKAKNSEIVKLQYAQDSAGREYYESKQIPLEFLPERECKVLELSEEGMKKEELMSLDEQEKDTERTL